MLFYFLKKYLNDRISKRDIFLIFIYFLLQPLILNSQAQKNTSIPRDVEMIFAHKHYSFTLIPFLDQKTGITENIDKYWIHSTIMHGLEAGFSRYSNFDKKHSLIIGLFFGAFARNFNFDIPGEEFNPPVDGHVTSNTALSREFNFTGSVPILFEKRWFRNENNFWNLNIGITIRYTPSEEEEEDYVLGISPGSDIRYLSIQLTTDISKRPLVKLQPWRRLLLDFKEQ